MVHQNSNTDTDSRNSSPVLAQMMDREKRRNTQTGRREQKPTKGPRRLAFTKPGKKTVKQEAGSVLITAKDWAIEIVAGNNAEEALNVATKTIASTELVDYNSEDQYGHQITKLKERPFWQRRGSHRGNRHASKSCNSVQSMS